MKRKKKRQKGFYKILAAAIVDGAPFDISNNNNGGWKKVQELVCLYMLRELSEADRHKLWAGYLEKVESCFYDAIRYINDNPDNLIQYKNIHIWLWRPEGKRNNEFLSIRKGYRNSLERNTERLIRRIEMVAKPAIKEIIKTESKRLDEGKNRIIGLFENQSNTKFVR